VELRILAEKICGDIVLAEDHGKVMRKWRQIFQLSQSEIAKKLGISPSVISDYEASRRKPGVKFLKKFVCTLLESDKERGYPIISKYKYLLETETNTILDIAEYSRIVNVHEFCEAIRGEMLNDFRRNISGHTVINSINAILSLNAFEFYKLYGFSTERALIFTQVSTGRSPMVAIRVSNLKPSVVVLHGIEPLKVDEIAIEISEIERIPLLTTSHDIHKIIDELRRRFV